MVTDLGAGEREVLALALETSDSVCVLDDALARQIAGALQLRVTGTLGVLIDAKRSGFIPAVRPLLDELHSLGFRLAPHTRAAVLKIAGESVG
jgi:predicted nucleic acid-binding protein